MKGDGAGFAHGHALFADGAVAQASQTDLHESSVLQGPSGGRSFFGRQRETGHDLHGFQPNGQGPRPTARGRQERQQCSGHGSLRRGRRGFVRRLGGMGSEHAPHDGQEQGERDLYRGIFGREEHVAQSPRLTASGGDDGAHKVLVGSSPVGPHGATAGQGHLQGATGVGAGVHVFRAKGAAEDHGPAVFAEEGGEGPIPPFHAVGPSSSVFQQQVDGAGGGPALKSDVGGGEVIETAGHGAVHVEGAAGHVGEHVPVGEVGHHPGRLFLRGQGVGVPRSGVAFEESQEGGHEGLCVGGFGGVPVELLEGIVGGSGVGLGRVGSVVPHARPGEDGAQSQQGGEFRGVVSEVSGQGSHHLSGGRDHVGASPGLDQAVDVSVEAAEGLAYVVHFGDGVFGGVVEVCEGYQVAEHGEGVAAASIDVFLAVVADADASF
mmetsp:Transcript_25023/g.57835  ORF Transcript_25023/g.57835 Transcript_25023/m.57835 type:complete len:435 (+) Transcript_25023:4255-5559(+)